VATWDEKIEDGRYLVRWVLGLFGGEIVSDDGGSWGPALEDIVCT
jgi:hypothetical protein